MGVTNIGMVINQLIVLVNSIFIGIAVARHLGSVEFYELAKITSFFMLASVLFRFGFEYRVLAYFKSDEYSKFISLPKKILLSSFFLSSLCLCSLVMFGPSMLVFALAVLPCALIPVLNTAFAVNKKSNTSAMFCIPLTITAAAARIIAIKMGYGLNVFLSLFVAEIVLSCILMIIATYIVEKRQELSVVTLPNISILFWPAVLTFLSLLSLKIPLFLGEYILVESELGSYAIALRVFESIIIIVSTLTTSRFFKFTGILDNKPDFFFVREARVISLALLIIYFLVLLIPLSVYFLVLGTQYEAAINSIKVLAIILPFQFTWNMADKVLLTSNIKLVVLRQVVLVITISILFFTLGLLVSLNSFFLCIILVFAYLFSYILLDFLLPQLWPTRNFKLKLIS